MKKRFMSILLALCLILGLLPTGVMAAEGDITISTAEELKAFRDRVNTGDTHEGKTVTLTADIDLGGGEADPWTPIGAYSGDTSKAFKGIFDGGGHTITGLYINTASNDQGLFGYVSYPGTVKNVGVGGTVTGGSSTGGVVGSNNGVVTGCYNMCTVSGDKNVGGVVGSGSVENSYNTGTVSGVNFVGGIVGGLYNGDRASCCYNTGAVTGTAENAEIGGVVGRSMGYVSTCYYSDVSCNTDGSAMSTKMTEEKFASGEVAWRFQRGQAEQIWGQGLCSTKDPYPLLTRDNAKRVYKVTFQVINDQWKEYAAAYTNLNGTVALPADEPTRDGFIFAGWSTSETGGTEFTASTQITGDMTVYAQFAHTHAVSVDCETDNGEQVTFKALTSENDALYVDGAAAEVSSTYKAYMLPAGNYYLAGDVRLDRQIRLTSQASGADPANTTVNVCLNGYKLEYAGDHNYSPVIYVGTNAYALNICDCNPDGTDRTGNVINDPVSGYTKVIWGGVITGGRYAGITGGDAPVTLYGGTIAGNGWAQASTPVYGGGVDADNFVMYGGAIRYNMATYGGGVNASDSFTMTGGTISGNWAATRNGGVHTVISSGVPTSVTLSGGANIMDNVMGALKTTPSNLNLVTDCVVTIAPEGLGEGFRVGISTSTTPIISAPVTVAQGSGDTALTTDDLTRFSNDNSDYALKLENGKIMLALSHKHFWAVAWSSDAAHHWHKCTSQGCTITDYANCGEDSAAYGPHVYDNGQDTTCNTCGYTRTVTLPEESGVKGEVEVKPDTPAVSVDKDDLKDLAGEAQAGDMVTVTLTVEKRADPECKDEIIGLVTGRKDDVLFLDLSLLKQVNEETPEIISDTGDKVLEITVPYDYTGKKDVTVYRKHGDNDAEKLTGLAARPSGDYMEGSFYADGAGKVYLYAGKFSTYAIGYTVQAVTPPPRPYEPPVNVSPVEPTPEQTGCPRDETCPLSAFPDVDPNSELHDALHYCVEKGLLRGYDDGLLRTENKLTRGMMVEILYNAAGRPQVAGTGGFVDVTEEDWYAPAAAWAARTGVVKGFEDGSFAADVLITREQIIVMLYRYATYTELLVPSIKESGNETGEGKHQLPPELADMTASSWAYDAIVWAINAGFLELAEDNDLTAPITRAQAVVILQGYMRHLEGK